jgi:hypothetical protein
MASAETKPQYMWANWLSLLLAVWLFISPWAVGFADSPAPSWNAWIFGVATGVLALIGVSTFAAWEDWVSLIVGVWLFISPWVLGFADVSEAAANFYIVGVLFVILEAWGVWAARREMARHPA